MIQKWPTVKRPSENERYYPPSRISKNNALSTFKQSIIRIQGFCTLTVQNCFRVASLHRCILHRVKGVTASNHQILMEREPQSLVIIRRLLKIGNHFNIKCPSATTVAIPKTDNNYQIEKRLWKSLHNRYNSNCPSTIHPTTYSTVF